MDLRRLVLAAALAAAPLACAHGGPPDPQWSFFVPAGAPDDVWERKVVDWQERARRDPDAELLVQASARASARSADLSGRLDVKMATWEGEERRALARRIATWAQQEARRHYRSDHAPDPLYDHWPTVAELLEANGDDCDGLDLIAYQLLREFGFRADRVYRLVVRRDRDGMNHMVTVWFEDADDPWVLDGTGALTQSLRRFSDLEGWTPTKMFNETRQFVVRPRDGASPVVAR